jgi:hypothetical protein
MSIRIRLPTSISMSELGGRALAVTVEERNVSAVVVADLRPVLALLV